MVHTSVSVKTLKCAETDSKIDMALKKYHKRNRVITVRSTIQYQDASEQTT